MRDTGEGTAVGDRRRERGEMGEQGCRPERGGRKWHPPPRTSSLSSQEWEAGHPVPVPIYKGRKDRPCGLEETTTSPAPSCPRGPEGSKWGDHTPLGRSPLRGMHPPTSPGVPPAELGHWSQPRLPDSSHS